MSKPLTKKQRARRNAKWLQYLRDYFRTYDSQGSWLEYRSTTLIDDVLYGLGVALDPEQYKHADGYDRFKERLREHLAVEPANEVMELDKAMREKK